MNHCLTLWTNLMPECRMVYAKPEKRLKKVLKLRDIYAISTGATLSAGFFLLPGIAAAQAGPALVLSYLLAALPMIPAMFSVIELATAMPRAGGVYYFLDRSLGPYFGTMGGLGTWLALILKVSFALIGMGAYISLFLPELPIVPIAVTIAVILGAVNIIGAEKGGGLQVLLVFGLLSILAVFLTGGALKFQPAHFNHFFAAGFDSIVATAGMVYISYVGVTKVASLSEEVEDPERNLPKGVILSLSTVIVVYLLGTLVMVGLVPPDVLNGNLTPAATAAEITMGRFGAMLLSIAALLAFLSVANAGLMSASRYPLAMSRDHLIPDFFQKTSRFDTPLSAILLTLIVVVAILVLFDPMRIAKLASAFQLLMFALVCLAVIIMRESRILSYDPGYRSPFYPWMQIAGILLPFYLIFEMGLVPILFSAGLVFAASCWYYYYARHRTTRTGALYHVFERLGHLRQKDLDTELRGILREKGLRKEDPFEDIVARSIALDFNAPATFEQIVEIVAQKLQARIHLSAEEVIKQVMDGTRIGATPVTHGVALPHFRTDRIENAEMVLVRARKGVTMTVYNPLTHAEEGDIKVGALFFLVSPDNDPALHLRILARIAERADEASFAKEWDKAKGQQQLRQSLLHDDRFLTLKITNRGPVRSLVGKPMSAFKLPKGCIAAMLYRGSHSFVPDGNTVLEAGDRLTIIGDTSALNRLRAKYTFTA